MQGRSRRLFFVVGIMVLLLAGASYTWTFTPSYSLYRIRQALLAHDYATFAYYVDVDNVLDHALDQLTGGQQQEGEDPKPRGPLAKLFKKGLLKNFVRDSREIVKAGLSIAVEQAVRDRDRPLPEIPPLAVVAALWHGQEEDRTVTFPVKVKKGEQIEIRARKNDAGVWRVIEIINLPALLPALKRHQAKPEQQASE